MKLMPVEKLAQAIKALDAGSAVNKTMLKRLFKDDILPSWKHGNRTVCDVDILIESLNKILKLSEKNVVPRIRSINEAIVEIRKENPCLGISEETIRSGVKKDKLPSIKVGNRFYIALESFEFPNDTWLLCNDLKESKKTIIANIVKEQVEQSKKSRAARNGKGGR